MSRFTAADDLIHDISGPLGRESLFWVVPVPAERALALAYLWRDAPTGKYGYMAGVTDRLADELRCFEGSGDLDLEGADLDDCAVGGLRVRQPEPLETCRIAYEGDGFSFDVSMRGLHAPFSWHDGPEGCYPWAADDRYEQSTATRGTLVVGERTIEFEGIGHRDHSWGTRDWRALQHWKWINAATPDGRLSLHGWVSFALGDRQVNGYVNRDGVVSPIVAADVKSQLDDRFWHTSVSGRFETADGRELALEATAVAGMPITARHIELKEAACDATLDGRPAIAHIEHGWPAAYIADYVEDATAAA